MLRFMSPWNHRAGESILKTFDATWEQIHSSRQWGQWPSEDVIRFISRNVATPRVGEIPPRVLDAGCGIGPVLWFLASVGVDAYGFDGSEAAVTAAQDLLRSKQLLASVLVADAGSLPYEDDFFDVVVDNGMITGNSLPNSRIILREVHRVMKQGGLFFSTKLFSRLTSSYGHGVAVEPHTFQSAENGTVHYWEKSEIRELWGQTGFNRCTIDREHRTLNGETTKVEYFVVRAEK